MQYCISQVCCNKAGQIAGPAANPSAYLVYLVLFMTR